MNRELPRLPLKGSIDLTYRCNNACRHCWLWVANEASEAQREMSFDDIRRVVGEARSFGCQGWAISGGEPMLRPDFAEIFDCLTRRSVFYSLNTNGTLITPSIARLLARKGNKMVALYGATADVHDRVTRNPGSFEATMRGLSYLKKAGAGFTVQIIPMAENYHQYSEMVELARSLSPSYRIGAPWLFLSAGHSDARNHEIARQRLAPAAVLALDGPDLAADLTEELNCCERAPLSCSATSGDDRLFASCIASRRDFHIDPYGMMSFCCFVKDPTLRFDLRKGPFREAWDDFIPSLAESVRGGKEYMDNCASCTLRQDCRWCGVYGYLEHGRFSAKVDYLCQVAAETRRFKDAWKQTHVRYYQIAGITIQLAADFPITDQTFAPELTKFEVDGPGSDNVGLRLFSSMPAVSEARLGSEVYRKPPWVIFRKSDSWVYRGVSSEDHEAIPFCLAIFDAAHTRGSIFLEASVDRGRPLHSLTTFPNDQILFAQLLADRQGAYIHASGIIIDGKGMLFVGHSGAGKSTVTKMLKEHGEILCDDRVVVRRWLEGFRIHGTWSHGELPDVSPSSAPLHAIMLLEQAPTNELLPITEKMERVGLVLSHVIRPLITADWWDKTLSIAEKVADEVPAYRLRFDKTGAVVGLVKQL